MRSSSDAIPGLVASFAIMAAFLTLAAILGTVLSGPKHLRIDPDDVRAFSHNAQNATTVRRQVDDPDYSQTDQFRLPNHQFKQFDWITPQERLVGEPLSIWIPFSEHEVLIYINGVLLDPATRPPTFAFGPSRHSRRVDLPDDQLSPGLNRISVLIPPGPHSVGLGPMYVGPTEELRTVQSRWYATANSIGLIWIVMGVLWSGAFGLALLSGTPFWPSRLFMAVGLWLSWLDRLEWDLAIPISAGLIVLSALSFLIRQAGRLGPIAQIAFSLIILTALLEIFVNLSPRWIAHREVIGVISASLVISGLALSLPALVLSDLRALNRRAQGYFEAILADEELRQNPSKALRAARLDAVTEERQRFRRDIHDGIGAQLTGLILRLRSGDATPEQLEQALTHGLADIRLMVDSLDTAGDSLGEALVDFRARAESHIVAAGMDFDWNQTHALDHLNLPEDQILCLYRFLQEAVNNALRHSQAERITIDLTVDDGLTSITVSDDGQGFNPDTARSGQGMRSLGQRAEALGAALDTRSAPGQGTSVRLLFPKV